MFPRTGRSQVDEDEELARRLQEEENGLYRQSQLQTPATSPLPTVDQSHHTTQPRRVQLNTGQSTAVRLLHVASGNYIGEIFDVTHTDASTIIFSVKMQPDLRLRVDEHGRVEFSRSIDAATLFNVELVTNSGPMFLRPVAYENRRNQLGQRSWYLTLTSEGMFHGDGGKNALAQWSLVATGDSNNTSRGSLPALAASSSSSGSSNSVNNSGFSRTSRPLLSTSASSSLPAPYAEIRNSGEEIINPIFPSQSSSNSSAGRSSNSATSTTASTSAAAAAAGVGAGNSRNVAMQAMGAVGPTGILSSQILSYTNIGDSFESIEQQLQWLGTAAGQAYINMLNKNAKAMYEAGTIRRVLYRPDWPVYTTRWKDYGSKQLMDSQQYRLNQTLARQFLSESRQRRFFRNGYVTLQQVIPAEQLKLARKIVLNSAGKASFNAQMISEGCYHLTGPIMEDADVLALFYETGLIHIAQLLIGDGEIVAVDRASEISVSYPVLADMPRSLQGTSWSLDAGPNGAHSPYTLLVGIALTDVVAPYAGNVCVFQGSQLLLQDYLKDQILSGKTDYAGSSPAPGKPFLSEPTQLLLRAGDAFVCSQKVARVKVPNISDNCTTMIFFKIKHVDHEVLKEPALDGVWLEYRDVNFDDDEPTGHREISSTTLSNGGNLFGDDDLEGDAEALMAEAEYAHTVSFYAEAEPVLLDPSMLQIEDDTVKEAGLEQSVRPPEPPSTQAMTEGDTSIKASKEGKKEKESDVVSFGLREAEDEERRQREKEQIRVKLEEEVKLKEEMKARMRAEMAQAKASAAMKVSANSDSSKESK